VKIGDLERLGFLRELRLCRILEKEAGDSGLYSFIETQLFTRLVQEYLNEQEYAALQRTLMEDPQSGDVVPGSGGVRKMRWAAPGRGKRGGYRVIYFVRHHHGIIWIPTMYPKNVADNIPGHVLRQIRKEIEDA
jgi:mRNA-degrading endonuclease RelE of RelBE toxin-antitoxin system